jgi:hypothetical protein
MFAKLVCSTKGHQINRHRVWHDSVDYRTRCARCDAELIRAVEGWREYDGTEQAGNRLPHPRERRQA